MPLLFRTDVILVSYCIVTDHHIQALPDLGEAGHVLRGRNDFFPD